jgi:hypothetical protein
MAERERNARYESLHVTGPDDQAADNYFASQLNMYQGSDHPQAEDRCEGGGPKVDETWRYGARAAGSFAQQAVDPNGHFTINLVDGAERFTNKVLFIASACQKVIGVE